MKKMIPSGERNFEPWYMCYTIHNFKKNICSLTWDIQSRPCYVRLWCSAWSGLSLYEKILWQKWGNDKKSYTNHPTSGTLLYGFHQCKSGSQEIMLCITFHRISHRKVKYSEVGCSVSVKKGTWMTGWSTTSQDQRIVVSSSLRARTRRN